jgi:hypothetical protein
LDSLHRSGVESVDAVDADGADDRGAAGGDVVSSAEHAASAATRIVQYARDTITHRSKRYDMLNLPPGPSDAVLLVVWGAAPASELHIPPGERNSSGEDDRRREPKPAPH